MVLKGRRALITGADGFIGSHLSEALRDRGTEVLTLSDADGRPIDIRDWERLRILGSSVGKIDIVFHLAALTFVPHSFDSPRETYEINVLGTLNVLELCRACDVGKVVFASSYIYGSPQYLPIDEEHPLNPASPYARSKLMGESLCKAFHEDYGLKCIILRPFNIYGERQSDAFLIPSIMRQIAGGRIELSDPEPKRDLLYISDMVEAYTRAGESEDADFRVYNIGAGSSYSVDDVVRSIMEIWGQQVEVKYQYLRRRNEIMDVMADFQLAKQELGWEPRVGLKEGLAKYAGWYKKQLNLKCEGPSNVGNA